MKKIILLALVLLPTSVYAQVRPTDKFAWTQDAASITVARAYRYELELDNVVLTTPLVATCTGTASPFACEAPIPAITPTSHTVRLRAVDSSNAAPLVSDWSDAFTFVMRAAPAKPTGIRIIPGG